MRNTRIADTLLMLVTSREHALATVGDLVEDASGRGRFWFWSSVFRTALSLLWRGLAAEPGQLAGVAFRGVILNFVLWLAAFVSFVVCGALILGLLRAVGLAHGNSASFPKAAEVHFTVIGLAIQFQLGSWMARRVPDRALAACVMFLAESAIATAILSAALITWYVGSNPDPAREPVPTIDILVPFGLARMLLYFLPLVGGAWWARRQRAPSLRCSPLAGRQSS